MFALGLWSVPDQLLLPDLYVRPRVSPVYAPLPRAVHSIEKELAVMIRAHPDAHRTPLYLSSRTPMRVSTDLIVDAPPHSQ